MFFVNARAIIERVVEDRTEIVIQVRNKPNEPTHQIELPGGRLEPYEPLLTALAREVKEETGLDITEVEGAHTRSDTSGMNPEFVVECIRPFAAYQTIKGPIDSVGYYFRCKAEGELLTSGDDTTGIRWIDVAELRSMFEQDPLQFTNVDRAGIQFYLMHGTGRSGEQS